jgi:hypothetical protein
MPATTTPDLQTSPAAETLAHRRGHLSLFFLTVGSEIHGSVLIFKTKGYLLI